MKKTNKKILELGILTIGILLITAGLVSAFTIGTPSGGVTVYPGETKDVSLRAVVDPSEGSMKLKVSLSDESGIARITDSSDVYSVSPGNAGIVNIKLTVPENAVIGQKYLVSLSVSDAESTNGGGMVSLGYIASTSFDVKVVEKPAVVIPETPAPAEGISLTWWILGIVAVIAIIAIIWFVVKSKKN